MSLETISIAEDQVAALGDVNRIRRHYEDELSVNELIHMVRRGEELAAEWPRLGAPEKSRFLSERSAVIAHAFNIAGRPEEQLSPLLVGPWKQAVAAWQQVMPKLLALA
jgi:hypothetical protein